MKSKIVILILHICLLFRSILDVLVFLRLKPEVFHDYHHTYGTYINTNVPVLHIRYAVLNL